MIDLRTFGATELRRAGTDVRSVLSQPKRLALLVYLRLAAPGGFVSRERLMGLFWPESDAEKARNALRQALHFLRRSLGDDAIVNRSDREVGVDPARVQCDAAAFLDALEGDRLGDALDLYRGEFLTGFYLEEAPEVERWIDEQRAELARRATAAAWSLSRRHEERSELSAAVVWARRAVALDPAGEAGARRLMELLARSGDRGAALQAYGELERALAERLELEPSPESARLAERIRAGDGPAAASGADDATPPVPGSGPQPAPAGAATVPTEAPAGNPPTPAPGGSEGGDPAPPPADGADRAPGAWRRRWIAPVAASLLLLALAAVAVPRFSGRTERPAEVAPSIAVLPFLDMSAGGGNEYFSDGVAEELLNVLASVQGLRVAARTSSFAFRDKDVTVDSIGRALDVTHVLEGSVRTAGDGVRITAQLIETASGFHVWSETYDRQLGDIFDVQDEIAAAIARKLQVELAGNAWGLSARETSDPEAYRLLLRAMHTFRTPSPANYATAVSLLEEAIGRDPRYARAHGALAYVLVWQGTLRFAPAADVYPRAERLAHRGLELGETPEAHLALAHLAEHQAWSPDSADAHFRRVLELNPADARAMGLWAVFLARSGRAEEAVATGRRATELDPLHPASWVNLANVLSMLSREEEALRMLERARVVAPGDALVLTNLANQYGNVGRLDDALTTLDAALALDPDDLHRQGLRVHLLFQAGRTAEAMERLAELEREEAMSRFDLATLYSHTDDTEHVLDLLEQSARRREPALLRLRSPDILVGVREHPRFIKLLAALESGGE